MQKGFRERRRSFEAIVVDQFVGKLGEVAVKRFLEAQFNVNVELDWDISPQRERHVNDIKNANKLISIKLLQVWQVYGLRRIRDTITE